MPRGYFSIAHYLSFVSSIFIGLLAARHVQFGDGADQEILVDTVLTNIGYFTRRCIAARVMGGSYSL